MKLVVKREPGSFEEKVIYMPQRYELIPIGKVKFCQHDKEIQKWMKKRVYNGEVRKCSICDEEVAIGHLKDQKSMLAVASVYKKQ